MSDKNFELRIKSINYLLLFLLLFGVQIAKGQIKKGETVFGLQLRGIVPIDLLNAGSGGFGNDSISVNLAAPAGFSFGGIVRHNFTKMFTIESGIHYIGRQYKLHFVHKLQGIDEFSTIKLISYEIPVQWLLYIRIGEQFYMNTLFGVSFNFYPSDIAKIEEKYAYIMVRKSWFNASLPASVGFEYRTKESGTFYLGMSLNYPLSLVGRVRVSYFKDPSDQTDFVNMDSDFRGTYFSIDFRYFFKKTIYKKEKNIW